MKNRILSLILVVLLIFTLTACGSKAPAQSSTPREGSPPPAQPQDAGGSPTVSTPETAPSLSDSEDNDPIIPAYEEELSLYSYTYKDHVGYETKFTLKIGSWIRGSDRETLNMAWKGVGGQEDLPELTSVSGYPFDPKMAVFVVGTITLENITPGFDITEDSTNSFPAISVVPETSDHNDFSNWRHVSHTLGDCVLGRQYSSGLTYDLAILAPQIVKPQMTSNKWGPVPIFLGIGNVFTPNYPEGNPLLDDVYVKFGDERFQIAKTWEAMPVRSLLEVNHTGIFGLFDQYGLSSESGVVFEGKWHRRTGLSWKNPLTEEDIKHYIVSKGGFYPEGASFTVSGLYKTLSGTMVVSAESEDCTDSSIFEFYGDGSLLYTSPAIVDSSSPIDFNIDIIGVKKITIECRSAGDSQQAPSVAFADTALIP